MKGGDVVLLTMAWRNLWRSRRRTLLTMTAIAVGALGVILLDAVRVSSFDAIVHQLTTQLVGHLQVHGRGYRDAPGLDVVVEHPADVEARIGNVVPGAHLQRRVIGAALAGSGVHASSVVVLGVQSASIPDAGGDDEAVHVVAGRGLSAPGRHEALVGTELALQLDVRPGDALELVGADRTGASVRTQVHVVGLCDAGTAELNASAVVVHLADAQEFYALHDAVHTIVVQLSGAAGEADDDDVAHAAHAIRGALDVQTLETLTWSELMPELKATMEQKARSQQAVDKILFVLVGLGVLNAMTMATFERTREFGVMLALGTTPRRIVALVVVESLLQGLLGLACGVALAAAGIAAFPHIDFGGLSRSDMMGIRMPASITLHLTLEPIVRVGALIVVTMLIGGLVPALRAARMAPIDAMRAS